MQISIRCWRSYFVFFSFIICSLLVTYCRTRTHFYTFEWFYSNAWITQCGNNINYYDLDQCSVGIAWEKHSILYWYVNIGKYWIEFKGTIYYHVHLITSKSYPTKSANETNKFDMNQWRVSPWLNCISLLESINKPWIEGIPFECNIWQIINTLICITIQFKNENKRLCNDM